VRVVSLLPSATEIVAALGAGDELVGVTHACDHPAGIELVPSVTSCAIDAAAPAGRIDAHVRATHATGGALYALDEATIRSLAPDLIFTQALCDVCAVMESDVRAVAARLSPPVPVVTLSATTIDGVLEDILRAGAALGRGAAAAALVDDLRGRMRRVHDTLEAARAPRPRVAVLEWTDPVFACGHWVPEMVRRAGGVEVVAPEGGHSRVVSLADVGAADPEIVVIAPCGYDLERARAEAMRVLGEPLWSVLDGRSLWALDANALTSRPGPRIVDGIEVMARIFNPSLFPPLDESFAWRLVPAPGPERAG
jgi:iron complex transport system substrate-binding protein